jgi:hypothetical protein
VKRDGSKTWQQKENCQSSVVILEAKTPETYGPGFNKWRVCRVLIGSYTFVQRQGHLILKRANSDRGLFSALGRRFLSSSARHSCIFISRFDSTHHQTKIISAHQLATERFDIRSSSYSSCSNLLSNGSGASR